VEEAEDPLKKKSARYPLNYYRRQGEVKVDVITGQGEWNELKDEFYNQHSLRQLYGGRAISFDNPMKRAFFERLFSTDLAHVTLLRVAGRIIASHFGVVWDRILFWGAPSFDVREQAYSPGLLLLALTMKSAGEWGWRGVDLTIGEGNLKERFSTTKVDLPSVDLYCHRLAWVKQRALDTAVRGMRQLTAAMGDGDLWASRIRPALVSLGKAFSVASHLGVARGIPWLIIKGVQSFWQTVTTTIYMSDQGSFQPPLAASGESRANQVYDLLRWSGDDPDTTAHLTETARKLPEAAKNGRIFHTLLIAGRLAAWGFSSRLEGDEGTADLRDFEALGEYAKTGALESLLGTVCSDWLQSGVSRLKLQVTSPSRQARTAFASLGFQPVESVILTSKFGHRRQKTIRY
jgi:hypothetical protein